MTSHISRIVGVGSLLLGLHCAADDIASPRTGYWPEVDASAGSAGAPGTAEWSPPLRAMDPPRPPPPPPPDPALQDIDGDGFSPAQGDCADNSAQINPGAYDFPRNGHDEDCQGGDADPAEDTCDTLALDSTDPNDGARALGLCRFVAIDSKQWGVLSAQYVQPDGEGQLLDPRQSGLLPSFGGIAPRSGRSVLALSSGIARAPGQPDYSDACDLFSPVSSAGPPGYPKETLACPEAQFGGVFDGAALELRIRVPTNARSLSFDSNFFTYEYPDWICQSYNDFFVALLEPKPLNLPDGNILFDQDGNPVSVNNSLLQVCEPGMHGGKMFACPQGPGALMGTGFGGESSCAGYGGAELPGWWGGGSDVGGNGAATGWLKTTAPVQPGSLITLRFAIWDSGDPKLDSLALIDHFSWSIDDTVITETKPIVPE